MPTRWPSTDWCRLDDSAVIRTGPLDSWLVITTIARVPTPTASPYGYSCPYSCPKRELTAASNVSTTHSLYSILTSNLRLVGLSIAELRRSQLDTGFLSQKGEETNCCTQSLHVLHRIRNGLFWDSVSGIRSHTGVTSKGWKVSHDGMGWSGCFSHLLSRYDCSHCAVIMTWLTSSSSFIFTRWGTTSSHLVLTSSNPFLYYCRLKSTG